MKKITVEHEIPSDNDYCSDGDTGGLRTLCQYLKMRQKTGKRGELPIWLPRCDLFKEWLESDYKEKLKCMACRVACGQEAQK